VRATTRSTTAGNVGVAVGWLTFESLVTMTECQAERQWMSEEEKLQTFWANYNQMYRDGHYFTIWLKNLGGSMDLPRLEGVAARTFLVTEDGRRFRARVVQDFKLPGLLGSDMAVVAFPRTDEEYRPVLRPEARWFKIVLRDFNHVLNTEVTFELPIQYDPRVTSLAARYRALVEKQKQQEKKAGAK
ncbi:MAG: hypothetical protein QJR13_09680, partial [Bacillota bacterium]|nr:hypothetical protein [Bacillota bacterium]